MKIVFNKDWKPTEVDIDKVNEYYRKERRHKVPNKLEHKSRKKQV